MESLRTDFITKSSYLPSIILPDQSSRPSSGVHYLRCKGWNKAEQKIAKPVISRRHHAGFGAHCYKNHSAPENLEVETSGSHLKTFQRKLDALSRFTTPAIIIATAFSTVSVSLLAVEKLSDVSPLFLVALFQAIVSVSLMNVYICGLNQLTDLESDKVNKPYRPLVTGEFSTNAALMITISSAVMSLLIGWISGSGPLLCSLSAWFAIGTIYSIRLPYLRWKKIPFGASLCIFCFQATWLLGTYLNIQTFVLGRPIILSKAMIVITTFILIYMVSLSQFKDIPDIEGDKLDGIQTLAVRFGAQKVFWSCIGFILFAYVVVFLASITSPNNWRKIILVASQVVLASVVWSHAKSTDLEDKAAIESFYGFLCKLIPVEYILIHLMR